MTPWKKAGLLPSIRWPAKRRTHPATKRARPMRHQVTQISTIPTMMTGDSDRVHHLIPRVGVLVIVLLHVAAECGHRDLPGN